MVSGVKPFDENVKERMAVLMTSTEKATHIDPARRMGLSFVRFCSEARASYASSSVQDRADLNAMEAGPKQLQLATGRNKPAQ